MINSYLCLKTCFKLSRLLDTIVVIRRWVFEYFALQLACVCFLRVCPSVCLFVCLFAVVWAVLPEMKDTYIHSLYQTVTPQCDPIATLKIISLILLHFFCANFLLLCCSFYSPEECLFISYKDNTDETRSVSYSIVLYEKCPIWTWTCIYSTTTTTVQMIDYVQLNSCGCWIVRLAEPALKTIQ